MNRLLDTAEYWTLGLGIAVLPLAYRAKRPDGPALRQAGYALGRAPEWQRLKTELPNEDTLRLWFTGPRRNLGIVTGWHGLVVLDFDDRASYAAWLAWAHSAGDPAQTVAEITYRVASARGMHVYIGIEEPVAPFSVGNIDVKAAGGYVLAPPSIHPSGKTYAAENEWAPVIHVERLADVFPFAPDARPPVAIGARHTGERDADAWDWCDTSVQHGAIQAVKERVTLFDLLPGAQSTSGDKRWWMTRCPLHDDQHESMWIDADRGRCGCLAGCTDKSMDVIGLYQRLHGCDVATAVRELRGGNEV